MPKPPKLPIRPKPPPKNPNMCIACQGSGKASNGFPCFPCGGSGRKKA